MKMRLVAFAAVTAGLGFAAGFVVARAREPVSSPIPTHVDEGGVEWGANAELPDVRWKTLVGSDGIPQADIQFGTFELAPNAVYPAHLHPAPELYFVLEGHARWTVGSDTFDAGPGTAVYTPPGTAHRMVNVGDERVRAVWAWWAPGGDRAVFDGGYRFVEPLPSAKTAPKSLVP
jgi:mannose-6-phosphate isomerase-like protein (cupin superfamily)